MSEQKRNTFETYKFVSIIIMVVLMFLSLLFVWGDSLYVAIGNESVSLYDKTFGVGLNYYIYTGWKNVVEYSVQYDNNPLVNFALYGSLIISLIGFIATVAVTYIFGIKGIIEGLKTLVKKENDTKISKNFIIIALTLFGYFIITNLFSFHLYGPAAIESSTEGYPYLGFVDLGWGSTIGGFFAWSGITYLLVYYAISKFNKQQITNSVRNILIAISFYFILSIIFNSLTSPVGLRIGMYKDGYNLLDLIVMILGIELYEETFMLLIGIVFVSVAIATSAILLFVHLLKHFVFNKEFNIIRTCIYSGILFVSSLVGVIIGNFAIDALILDYNISSGTINNMPGILTNTVITLTLVIAIICLMKSKEQIEIKEVE